MKKIIRSLFPVLALLVVLSATGCREKRDLILGEPFSKLEGINGAWRLAQVEQVGLKEGSKQWGFDLTSAVVGADPAQLTFNATDLTFTYVPNGSRDLLKLTGGSWAFDDVDYPTMVSLDDAAVDVDLKLLAAIRIIDDQLKLQLRRQDCDNGWVLAYNLIFERQ